MSINIGDRISQQQRRWLSRAKSGVEVDDIGLLLFRLFRNKKSVAEKKELHSEWLDIYRRHKEQLEMEMPSGIFQQLDKFFGSVLLYEQLVSEVNPSESKIAFLLGAGASKPSDIPTVKELLSELLKRARRLDREEVTRLADFCQESKIDNIEDLLTAVRISEFCSKNSEVMRLVNFLIFSEEDEFEEVQLPSRYDRKSIDTSSVAWDSRHFSNPLWSVV